MRTYAKGSIGPPAGEVYWFKRSLVHNEDIQMQPRCRSIKLKRHDVALLLSFIGVATLLSYGFVDSSSPNVLTGQSAFVSSTTVKAGLYRKITVADLPKPFATESVATKSHIVPRPEGALPQAPPGYKVQLFATGFQVPRIILIAPNGDAFVADSRTGQVLVLHGLTGEGKPETTSTFASGLHEPYGMVFYPTRNPQWLYVANTDSVVRYRYTKGDRKAKSPADIVIKELPSSRPRDQEAFSAYDRAVEAGKQPPDHGHWTRDLALSLDGKRLFVAVGSASNLD